MEVIARGDATVTTAHAHVPPLHVNALVSIARVPAPVTEAAPPIVHTA